MKVTLIIASALMKFAKCQLQTECSQFAGSVFAAFSRLVSLKQ